MKKRPSRIKDEFVSICVFKQKKKKRNSHKKIFLPLQ